jgi:pilus assembly protein CpaF
VSQVGRRIDESSPMVDARLPDGSRVNAIIPPLAVDGPALTIRKFAKDPFQVDDLVSFGTLTQEIAELLDACVRGRLNILVSGGTGTGKTTLLNVLSSFIPDRRAHRHHRGRRRAPAAPGARRPAREPAAEHRGQGRGHDPRPRPQRAAHAPDRIIVGEVRGGEALDMLQAMNTGHDGLAVHRARQQPPRRDVPARDDGADGRAWTCRARDPRAGRLRHRPHRAPHPPARRQPPHHPRHRGARHGGRRHPPGHLRLFDYARPTGIRPRFTTHLEELGISIPSSVFGGLFDAARLDVVAGDGGVSR